VIVVERARGRATISFLDFLVVGAPIAVISLVMGAAWLALLR
jgi:Na+/H+ antiporter NhaD/arsenite permease-like protein